MKLDLHDHIGLIQKILSIKSLINIKFLQILQK